MKSSLSIWHLLHSVKLMVKISSIFVVFLENMNLTTMNAWYVVCLKKKLSSLMKSSPSIWHYGVNVKSTVKISSVCVAFLENINFTTMKAW